MAENDNPNLVTVTLDEPLKLGEKEISSFQLRKPNSGELRGLSLMQLGQMNVDELLKLLPRITLPPIPAQILATMAISDMMEVADIITDFLLSKGRKAALPTT